MERMRRIQRRSGAATWTPEAASGPEHGVLALQQSAGNRAVSRLVQAKLEVGAANDAYEQEADRVADRVVGGEPAGAQRIADQITPLAQRQEVPEEEELQTLRLQRQEVPEEEELAQGLRLQREAVPEEEEELQMLPLQRRGDDGAFTAPAEAEERIAARQGGGKALDDGLRTEMEAGFGVDFGHVRVHDDPEAQQLAGSLKSRAFTQGSDIYVGKGGVDKKEMAHELTHVVQQAGGAQRLPEADPEVQRLRRKR
jgi:hypothetical protein